jgi:hypothetical protein
MMGLLILRVVGHDSDVWYARHWEYKLKIRDSRRRCREYYPRCATGKHRLEMLCLTSWKPPCVRMSLLSSFTLPWVIETEVEWDRNSVDYGRDL